MTSSEVSICNMALGWLGANLITSLDVNQENIDKVQNEVRLCNANYAEARDAVLEDHDWSFARARATLTPTSEKTEFGELNRFPIRPDTIRILSVGNNPNFNTLIEWSLEERHIVASFDRIYVIYTKQITDTNKFSPAFRAALAQRLAADMAIPLTESRAIQENHWELYRAKIAAAAATDGLQGVNKTLTASGLQRARRGFVSSSGGWY